MCSMYCYVPCFVSTLVYYVDMLTWSVVVGDSGVIHIAEGLASNSTLEMLSW